MLVSWVSLVDLMVLDRVWKKNVSLLVSAVSIVSCVLLSVRLVFGFGSVSGVRFIGCSVI